MRFFTLGIALSAYRSFSTKGFSKPPYGSYGIGKHKTAKTTTITTTERKRQQRRPRIQWTEEQKSVLSAVTQGKSVFITGSAGTGKTKLLTEVVKLLKKLHTPSKVFVTASTGVAAFALKGLTLHSFAGIHCSIDDPEKMLDRIMHNRRACRRWLKAKVIVIDEVSMVDGRLVDSLEYVARKLRGVDQTWGGIQLVVVGDFCQLPPIPDDDSKVVKYAFEAKCWDESFDLQIELTKIFRQSDPQFIELLQGIRKGEIDHVDLSLLERCSSETECDPSVVKLFPLKNKVRKVNEKMLKSLQKDVVVYRAVDSGVDPWKKQLRQGIVPDEISICEGARVMLVKNLHTWKGLVNGATGTVVGFIKSLNVDNDMCVDRLLPTVEFDSGKVLTIEPEEWSIMEGDEVVARRKQIPLTLAWALSIHKCQGMTLDKAYIDLSTAFGVGMVYTAVSRVKALDGLHLSGFTPSKILVDRNVSEFYRKLANKDLDKSCIKSEDGPSSIAGAAENAGTAEKYYFSLAEFLSRRMKRP